MPHYLFLPLLLRLVFVPLAFFFFFCGVYFVFYVLYLSPTIFLSFCYFCCWNILPGFVFFSKVFKFTHFFSISFRIVIGSVFPKATYILSVLSILFIRFLFSIKLYDFNSCAGYSSSKKEISRPCSNSNKFAIFTFIKNSFW